MYNESLNKFFLSNLLKKKYSLWVRIKIFNFQKAVTMAPNLRFVDGHLGCIKLMRNAIMHYRVFKKIYIFLILKCKH